MTLLSSVAVVNGRGAQAPSEYPFIAYWVEVAQRGGTGVDSDRLRGLLVAYDEALAELHCQRNELAMLRHAVCSLSFAMGSPAVHGGKHTTPEVETIRLAAERLRVAREREDQHNADGMKTLEDVGFKSGGGL